MTYRDVYTQPMTVALQLARLAASNGDVPVGAVVLDSTGAIIGRGYNQREIPPYDPSAHAEVVALRQAAKRLGRWRLDGCTLVVTLEPCAMCAGAIVNARIATVVFGAWDDKAGACGSTRDIVRDERLNHRVAVYSGVLADQSHTLLRTFFAHKRAIEDASDHEV